MFDRFLRTPRLAVLAAAFAGAAVGACSDDEPTSSARDEAVARLASIPSGDQNADRATLEQVKQTVRDLARGGPCADGSCSVLPLGQKPCGGTAEYVAFCPTNTDVPRIEAAAREVERAERAYNERYNIAFSDCSVAALPACSAQSMGGAK